MKPTARELEDIKGKAHERVMQDTSNESIPELYSKFEIEEAYEAGFSQGQEMERTKAERWERKLRELCEERD